VMAAVDAAHGGRHERGGGGGKSAATGGGDAMGDGGVGEQRRASRAGAEAEAEAEEKARLTLAEVSRQQQAMFIAMGPQMMASYAAYMAAYVQAGAFHPGAFGAAALGAGGVAGGAATVGGMSSPLGHRYHHHHGGGGGGVMHGEATSARRAMGGGATTTTKTKATKATKTKSMKASGTSGNRVVKAPTSSRKSSKPKEAKVCVNCKSMDTPYWRKDKDGVGSLCNACGLYLAKNDAPRPALLWRRDSASFPGSGSGASDGERQDASATPPESSEGDDARGAMPGVYVDKEQPLPGEALESEIK